MLTGPFPRALLAIATLACLDAAHATTVGTWYDIEAVNGSFTITYKNKQYDLTASPKQYLDDQVWYYNANLVPQNPSAVSADVEKQYGLLAGQLALIGYCDNHPGGSCSQGAYAYGAGTTSTFTSSKAFDYLAVHLGQGELLFNWAIPTKTFTLSGLPTTNISDYRAFLGPQQVLATPLPGAAGLFATGLAVLGFRRRRRSRLQPARS